MDMIELDVSRLRAHPMNSNVMDDHLLAKLTDHIARTGQYPPVIVRPLPADGDIPSGNEHDSCFQILDGHHRIKAIKQLKQTMVRCVVWEVDDAQALVLLATLNRLQGQDDPHKRAALIAKLQMERGIELSRLSLLLPERAEQLEALAALNDLPRQRLPRRVDDLPVSVHFFLSRQQRSELEAKLNSAGGTREEALMNLVAAAPTQA